MGKVYIDDETKTKLAALLDTPEWREHTYTSFIEEAIARLAPDFVARYVPPPPEGDE